ncbi:MAG: hypothetical protein IJ226_01150, partial [Clostridia bacterium]|nr:hypothetical protein [Clostridia bacterium]
LKDGDSLAHVIELEIDGDTLLVGTFDIIATTINDDYSVTCEAPGTYTLIPRKICVSVNDKSSYYGDELLPLDATLTSGTLVGDDTLDEILSFDKAEGKVAGEYKIDCACLEENYNATITYGKYTILPRPITVSVSDAASVYGDEVMPNKVELVSGTFAYSDTLDSVVTVTKPSTTRAGVYEITAHANSNYNLTAQYTNGTHSLNTISKRDVSSLIEFDIEDGATLVEGGKVFYSLDVSVERVVRTYTLNGEPTTNPNGIGEYSLTVTVQDDNYCGEKTIHYSTYASVAEKMSTFSSLLDAYHSPNATDSEKISALFECQQLYANMTETDMAQIEASDEYTYLIDAFASDWETLRQGANEDLQQAEKVNSKALALYLGVVAVSLALGAMALKFFL